MKKNKKGGLSPKSFGGLSKKRMEKGQASDRIFMKKGETATVQFLGATDDEEVFREFYVHQFQDGGRWTYVPCAEDNCPLCEDEDPQVSKAHYRFCTSVYSLKDKKVAILEGPKDLAGRIDRKCSRNAKKFLRKTWDISKLDTTPVSYEVEEADDRAVSTDGLKPMSLPGYIEQEQRRYFGNDMPTESKKSGKTALDDDDDDAEDDSFDEDELEEMSTKEIKKIAKSLKISLDNPKNNEPRSKSRLIQLILKKQS